MANVHMLTTVDNPYNPFTEFDEWYRFDNQAGYHTTGYLARIAKLSDDMSEADQSLALELAMTEIIEENVYGIHRLVEAPEGWEE